MHNMNDELIKLAEGYAKRERYIAPISKGESIASNDCCYGTLAACVKECRKEEGDENIRAVMGSIARDLYTTIEDVSFRRAAYAERTVNGDSRVVATKYRLTIKQGGEWFELSHVLVVYGVIVPDMTLENAKTYRAFLRAWLMDGMTISAAWDRAKPSKASVTKAVLAAALMQANAKIMELEAKIK